jgi:hypothetical protein
MSVGSLARIALIGSMLAGLGAPGMLAAQRADVIVASGTLDDRFLHQSLFHIGEFWIRVPSDTEYNRWLSQGIGHRIVILLTDDPTKFGDVANVRILSGTLIHNIAPAPTPMTEDVIGRLPEGDMGFVHILFLKDELSGIFSPITFETKDRVEATKFEAYNGKPINIVIQIERMTR